MTDAVIFDAVSKRFGGVTAVDGVSFAIAAGETVALLGPSGCGKTTILRLIAGFEAPNQGTVRIGGEDMARRRPYERNVGLLFQHYALFPHMTVAQNVGYGLRHRGVARTEIPRRVSDMLALVKLPDHGTRHPHQLSGGQQQRVALARALATRPGVVLLDEPLSALDAKLRLELRSELKTVLAAVGSTVIVVTHDQEEAMSLGERVFVMNAGRIVQQGPPAEIYARPTSRFVAEFLGRSNWFAGRLAGSDGNRQRFETVCGLQLSVAMPPPDSAGCELCVRPESIDLLPDQSIGPLAGRNAVRGRVREVVLLGASRQVVLEIAGGGRLLAIEPNRAGTGRAPGDFAIACFPAEDCILVPSPPEQPQPP
jgi:ABC-type Fe3+/spermidine/putrescine transport system ATPase subunit